MVNKTAINKVLDTPKNSDAKILVRSIVFVNIVITLRIKVSWLTKQQSTRFLIHQKTQTQKF